MTSDPETVVVADANILINLIHVSRLELLMVEEADSDKTILEGKRTKMIFRSFREQLEAADTEPRRQSPR